jgi:multidrug resistance efflux pump
VGTIEVPQARPAVLLTSGQVNEIAVEVGDAVQTGDLLVALDTTQLKWALEQAEIGFETAHINYEVLGETVSESDVKVAEANLLLAQENLALAQTGPTDEEVAAAQAAVQAGWAHYEELQQQPTQAQINQALANLSLAEIDVQAAQREYDKIAWLPEAAATEAADALHRATVALEAAQVAYDEASQPAGESELQTALSSAQSAQAIP